MEIDQKEKTRTEQAAAQPRRRFWEMNDLLGCPVIGICLKLSEQRHILKKARVYSPDMTDYEIHEQLVQSQKTESPLSARINRYLEQKFRREIDELGYCPEKSFRTRWNKALKTGEIEGLLWIGVTNPNLSISLINKLLIDVHMLMHRQGEIVREELRQAARIRSQCNDLKADLQASRQKIRIAREELEEVKKGEKELQREIRSLEEENQRLRESEKSESVKKKNAALLARIVKLESTLDYRNTALEKIREENTSLKTHLSTQIQANQSAQVEIDLLLRLMERESLECESCPDWDLCDKRILLVGGMSRLRGAYQKLVASMGGEFKYHDGNNNGGERALQELVTWADVVLCPIDINSHHASLGVKKICKRMAKPYHILRSSSISSISQALDTVAQERV
jgi:hypothetical protein